MPDGRGRISVHRFPKAKRMRKIWINFVNNTRSDFVCTNNSVICSDHFTEDCFDPSFALKQQFGLDSSRGRTLLDGKYPSIKCKVQVEPEDKLNLEASSTPSTSAAVTAIQCYQDGTPHQPIKKRRFASERRQRQQVKGRKYHQNLNHLGTIFCG